MYCICITLAIYFPTGFRAECTLPARAEAVLPPLSFRRLVHNRREPCLTCDQEQASKQPYMPKLSDAARHRTRTISFRTSEQTEYAIDLMARKHGLTKTAVLQFALRHLLRDPNEGLALADGSRVSFEKIATETWSPDAAARLERLAERYPDLLSADEHDQLAPKREKGRSGAPRVPGHAVEKL